MKFLYDLTCTGYNLFHKISVAIARGSVVIRVLSRESTVPSFVMVLRLYLTLGPGDTPQDELDPL